MKTTIEQKAKAYDEALEKAREYYNSPRTCFDIDALQNIFPELKESEDERIRKHLIARLKPLAENDGIFDFLITKDKVLAYLERQKESDGAWTEEDDAKVKAMCEEGDLKPSEREWLKKLKNRIAKKEQQPAEWSEEDENALVYLHELISFGFAEKFFDAQTADDMRDWVNSKFESLRPQLKRSGEDRKFIKHCTEILDEQGEPIVRVTPRAPLPKPHWKPSEEQMRYLLAVINDPNNIGAESCYMTIKSLYNDLKKL